MRQESGRRLATEPLPTAGPTVPQERLSCRQVGLPGRPSISTDKGRPLSSRSMEKLLPVGDRAEYCDSPRLTPKHRNPEWASKVR